MSGELIELVPLAGTPANCLVFSISTSGVVRQLTTTPGSPRRGMTTDATSMDCESGKPIGGQPFHIPAREGKVRIHAFFSDQKLAAAPIAAQLEELRNKPDLTVLDLRAPGRVVTDTLEFAPETSD